MNRPKTVTLPQQVAEAQASAPYGIQDDWQLLARVLERHRLVEFERPPQNTVELVSILRTIPTIEQIGRARRSAKKNKYLELWQQFYNTPTGAVERRGNNIPYEYQRLDERDEL